MMTTSVPFDYPSENSICSLSQLNIDAIIVLGGGVPSSGTMPPEYVKIRCDAAASMFKEKQQRNEQNLPVIVCLSAGTAHLPQLLSVDGLPIWESTASAGYLFQEHDIPKNKVFAETTSYDTISNAFFTRSNFTDIMCWNNLLIITNEFHMNRTKAIFDWIFSIPRTSNKDNNERNTYNLNYLSCANIHLSEEAISTRKAHEARGEKNVKERLSKTYQTLPQVWEFLNHQHDFYTAHKLVARATKNDNTNDEKNDNKLLKDSYGASK